ncbi:insulinase family protein [bacterium]|nr:insulinase family protein [bacterium]
MNRIDIKRKILPNGLTLLVNENHFLPICTMMAWFRVGGRNEKPGLTGMSHYLEHCYSMGTQRFKPRENSWLIQRAGGTKNAFTSHDYTAYYANVPADFLESLMDMEADRLINLALPEPNVVSEKEVIKEEKRLRYDDSPFGKLFETLYDLSYENHPYKYPVIGTWDDLIAMTRDQMVDYYKHHYVPENIVLVIAGDVTFERALSLTEKYFGGIPKTNFSGPPIPSENTQLSERRKIIQKESELPALAMAYLTVNVDHPDYIPLIFLSAVLSSGKSSRLHQSLVYRRQMATFASASFSAAKDPGLFQFMAQAQPGHTISEIEQAIADEINKLQQGEITDEEYERVKNLVEAGFIYSMETNENRAEMMGRYEILSEKYGAEYLNHSLELFHATTKADIRRVAQTYFSDERKNTVILEPIKKN